MCSRVSRDFVSGFLFPLPFPEDRTSAIMKERANKNATFVVPSSAGNREKKKKKKKREKGEVACFYAPIKRKSPGETAAYNFSFTRTKRERGENEERHDEKEITEREE